MSKQTTKLRVQNEITTALLVDSITPSILGSIIDECIDLIPAVPEGEKLVKGRLTVHNDVKTNGLLIVGFNYIISVLQPGDDFTNCGFVALNTYFKATSTTPNVWSNLTNVDGLGVKDVAILKNTLGQEIVLDYDPNLYTVKIVSPNAFPTGRGIYFTSQQDRLGMGMKEITPSELRFNPQEMEKPVCFSIEVY